MNTERQETLQDRIATAIQEGHTAQKTSDEIASTVMEIFLLFRKNAHLPRWEKP